MLLRCSTAEAFRLFTERVSEWWPETHRPSKDPKSELRLEPDGRFWERARDGRQVELGRVKLWDPPHRLALDFYVGTNAAHPTAVEVTFRPENDGTRVSVQHRPMPESASWWEQRVPAFETAWNAVLCALANW